MKPNYFLLSFVLFLSTLCNVAYSQRNERSSKHPEAGKFILEDKQGKKGTAKECIEKRDEFSKTFQYTDGSFTKQNGTIPMHYKDDEGNWLSYSMSLENKGQKFRFHAPLETGYNKAAGTIYVNGVNGNKVTYGANTSLTLVNPNGVYPFANPSIASPVVSYVEGKVSNNNFWNGVSRHTYLTNGFSETDYVVNQPFAQLQQGGYVKISEEYMLPAGAKVAKGEGKKGAKGFIGDLEISDANGELLFYIFKANVYDNSGDSTHTTTGEYSYVLNNNKLKLDVWVEAAYFNNPAISYPVTIDPQLSAYVGSWYSFARSSWGFTTNCMQYDYINVPQSTVTGWYNNSYYYRGGTSSGLRYVRVSYQQQWQGNTTYGCCATNWWWQTPYYNTGTGPWGGGNMTFNVQAYNTAYCCSGCSSSSGYRNYGYYYIDYTQQPANPSAANANINPVCNPGQTITLSASNPVGTVYWYSGGCGSNFIGTGTNINVNPNTTTTYFARNYANSQFSNGCASITVTVAATPAAPTAANVSITCAQTAALSASGAGTLTWYANSNATGQLGTGASYTTPSINANTTYYVASNVSGCVSSLTPVTVTVNAATTPTSANVNVNCGQTATLSASANAPLYWFSNANGTGALGTGNSYTTAAINSPTMVYVQAGTGACASQLVAVTAAPNVAQPSVANTSTNCGQTASVTASGANAYYWYSNAAGTNQVGSSATYTTPALNANTTYYVGGASGAAQSATQVYTITSTGQLFNMGSTCGAGSYYNCSSGLRGFNWVDNLPAGTQITNVQIQISVGVVCTNGALQTFMNNNAGSSFSPNSHCNCSGSNNGIFTLNFPGNQYVVGGANQFRINATNCMGLFNGNGSLSGQFARITVTYQGASCISPLVPVLITVNQASAPSAANQTVSCLNTATFTASSNAPVTWFSNANGTGQVGSGANFTSPSLSTNTT